MQKARSAFDLFISKVLMFRPLISTTFLANACSELKLPCVRSLLSSNDDFPTITFILADCSDVGGKTAGFNQLGRLGREAVGAAQQNVPAALLQPAQASYRVFGSC